MSERRRETSALCARLQTDRTRQGLVLIAIAGAQLLVMMDYSIINVALQTIQKDFSASNAQVQWVVSAYEILYAALVLPMGFLADRFGRVRVLSTGLTVFLIGSGFMPFAMSPAQIIAARAVMGVGGSVVPATTLAIIKDFFPVDRQAWAMGVWSAVGGASTAVGPILGGFLLESYPWWSIFIINVPIIVGCVVILLMATPESHAPAEGRLDVGGVGLVILSVASLVAGIIQGGQTADWISPGTGGAILAAIVLMVVLVWFERRQHRPVLDVSLLRHRGFAAGTMSISLAYFALSGGTFLLVFYIQLIRGMTPLQLGVSMLPVAVGAVAGSLLAQRLVHLVGARWTITTGMALLMIGFASFALAGTTTPLSWIEVAFLTVGGGMGLTMGATTP